MKITGFDVMSYKNAVSAEVSKHFYNFIYRRFILYHLICDVGKARNSRYNLPPRICQLVKSGNYLTMNDFYRADFCYFCFP